MGEEELEALRAPPPHVKSVLIGLLNDLSSMAQPIILVLDDHDAIDDPGVDSAVAFLLDPLPLQLHVVITTRQEPNLPLARLRTRGQHTELRAVELRFDPGEVAEYLTAVMA